MINSADKEYNKVLKEIVLNNLKPIPIYNKIVDDYKLGKVTQDEAYNLILKLSNNNLKNAMRNKQQDRTGTGTYKIFNQQMVFDLNEGFPLLTTKKVYTRAIFEELFWFIKGDTELRSLANKNVRIWDEWPFQNYLVEEGLDKTIIKYSDEWKKEKKKFIKRIKTDDEFNKKYGNLGPIYGAQWRNFGGHDIFKTKVAELLKNNEQFKEEFELLIKKYDLPEFNNEGVDQLSNLINSLKNNPNDRRMLVFAYNPKEVNQQALPACHAFFQVFVKDNKLSLSMYQRSADMFLGVPFNIASYAALAHMLAQVAGLEVDKFYLTLGDTHIYDNHIEQVQEQLSRKSHPMPKISLNKKIKNIEDFTIDDIKIENYISEEKIEAEVSV
jgi:thymidylate synthase